MKQNKEKLSLERRILNASHLPDVATGIVILLYTVFILNLNLKLHYPIILGVILGVLFAQFGISPITNHFLMGKVSKRVKKWETEETTVEERTKLLLDIHKLPGRKEREAFLYFFVKTMLLYNYVRI